jgi:LIVCS family branched-chain amino acid:cation transporter
LALGQIAQDQNFSAILGMLITAVGVPFLGLISMTLFDGDYKQFFDRIGKVPGFIVAAAILGLIGPFGAMPRCIALSYSTMQVLVPNMSLPIFSAISCVVIWLFTFKRNTILETLGYFLTPILLLSLAVIIVKGLFMSEAAPVANHDSFAIFLKGLKDGYQTMDLLGAFFFSSVIIAGLKSAAGVSENKHPKKLIITALKSSCIGAFLLAIVYIGFSYVASYHSAALNDVSSDELISRIAIHILGSHAAIIACIAVALACLTTAIALGSVFAEFIHKDISMGKVGYGPSLIITLVITFLISTLNFTGIAAILAPILQVGYPALIAMAVLNLMFKLYNFKPIKLPVLIVFLISIGAFFI